MKQLSKIEDCLEVLVMDHMFQQDELTLMVKNDHTIYAYWNLSERKKRMIELHFRKPLEELATTMKIYDKTEYSCNGQNEQRSILLRIPPNVRHLFITDMEPNRSYLAQYGVISNDSQKFFSLFQSTVIKTPRNGKMGQDNWSEIEWSIEKTFNMDEIIDHLSAYTYYETSLKNGSVIE